MEQINSIKLLKQVETAFDVMSVKYKGISVWPFVRVYLEDSLSLNKAQKASISNVFFIIQHLFDYNPFTILKKHKIWIYDETASLRYIGNKFIHQVSGPILELFPSSLVIANPGQSNMAIPMKHVIEKDVFGNSWCIMIARALSILSRKKSMKIENEDVFIKINEYLGIEFNYRYYIKHLFSQKKAVDFLLWIGKKPKMVFMICPYAQMGYVLSFHNHGIPVIELQHGVLNKDHYAYNSLYHSDILHPDEICVYGKEEYKYFTEEQKKYTSRVSITGLYILELSDKYLTTDIFKEERRRFDTIIVVAGQTPFEKDLSSFIEEVAEKVPKVLFIYKPRKNTERLSFTFPNIQVVKNVNIYEYLKWCDVHVTISSTTCLEAHYFKKPTIFYDKASMGSSYYGDILKEENGAFYVKDVGTFISSIDKVLNKKFVYKTFFEKNCLINYKKVIEKYDTNI